MGENDSEQGRLHLVQPAVHPAILMAVFRRLAVVPQASNSFGKQRIFGEHGAAVAKGAEVLRRIEAERSHVPDCADLLAPELSAMRLGAIFEYQQPRRFRD